MTVQRKYLAPLKMIYVRAEEPFSLDQLIEQAQEDLSDSERAAMVSMPLILDFRAVNLVQMPTEAFQSLIRKRRALSTKITDNPCAYVAADDSSFGMLRLYTAYTELEGFRSAGNTMVTTDLTEAARWIYPRLGFDQGGPDAVLRAIAGVTPADRLVDDPHPDRVQMPIPYAHARSARTRS